MKTTVLGAGSWGTALAILLAKKEIPTNLWARSPESAFLLKEKREKTLYLPGHIFPKSLEVIDNTEDAVKFGEVIVVAIPAQHIRGILSKLSPTLFEGKLIVIVSKGLEVGTGNRMTEVVHSTTLVPFEKIAILYGPSHAEEVAKDHPTAIVCASASEATARTVQQLFQADMFRVYRNSDVLGVEVAGSVKNVMAIAAGILDGLGYRDNATAALITRGLAEISRLGEALSAQPKTFSGLAGVGDLIVTCLSRHSRNRNLGYQIGQGKKLQDIIKSTKMIAEGVETTKATLLVAKLKGIEMPITEAVYNVLFNDVSAAIAVKDLMTRELKSE